MVSVVNLIQYSLEMIAHLHINAILHHTVALNDSEVIFQSKFFSSKIDL